MVFYTTKIIPRRQWISQYDVSDQGLPTSSKSKNSSLTSNAYGNSTESMMNGYYLQNDSSNSHGNDPTHGSHQNKSKFASRLMQYKLNRKRIVLCSLAIAIVTFNGLQFKFSGLPARLQSFYTNSYSISDSGKNELKAEQEEQQQSPQDRNLSGCGELTAEQQRSLKTRNLSGCELDSYVTPKQASMLLSSLDNFDTDVYTEPSHIKLCKELVKRNKQVENVEAYSNPFVNKFKEHGSLMIHETQEDCNDWKRPHSRLMQIISSAIIAYVGKPFGLDYKHNCHPVSNRNFDFDVTTAQQVLSQNDILLNENILSRGSVVYDLCQECIVQEKDPAFIEKRKKMKEQNIEDTHHCFLFPDHGDVHMGFVVKHEGEEATEEILDPDDNVIHTGLEAVLPLIRNRLAHLSLDRSRKAYIPVGDPKHGTVIYIDATQSLPIPFHYFSGALPKEATHVSIMTSPTCVNSNLGDESDRNCYTYGLGLQKYLENEFPGTGVSFDLVSSTATLYSRMIQTHFLVCPPGTITCLFPALARERTKPTIIFESELRASTLHWFKYLALSKTSKGVSATRGIRISPLHNDNMESDEKQLTIEEQYQSMTRERVMDIGREKSSNAGRISYDLQNVDSVDVKSKSTNSAYSPKDSDNRNTDKSEGQIGEVRFGGDRPSDSGTPLSDQQDGNNVGLEMPRKDNYQNADISQSDLRGRPNQESEEISLPFITNRERLFSNENDLSLPSRVRENSGINQQRVSPNVNKVSLPDQGEISF